MVLMQAEPSQTCSIDGCDSPHYGRGWCSMHYQRWWIRGDPLGPPPPRKRKAPKLDEPGWLRREYEVKGRTLADIGKEVGAVRTTVLTALRRHGVTPRKTYARHGHSGTLTYGSWSAMVNRCTNPRHRQWGHYGGRGITVCDRWRGDAGFIHFLADMGEKPDGLSLDRIDNDGNYEPENCRWATTAQQNANRRPRGTARGNMRTVDEVQKLLDEAKASEALGSRPVSAAIVEVLEWVLGENREWPSVEQ